MRINNTLLKPIVTEKTMKEKGMYAFHVNMEATKGSVVKTLKESYGVDAVDVRTLIVRGKKRRLGKTQLYRNTGNWKKAVVKLKEGQTIDMFAETK